MPGLIAHLQRSALQEILAGMPGLREKVPCIGRDYRHFQKKKKKEGKARTPGVRGEVQMSGSARMVRKRKHCYEGNALTLQCDRRLYCLTLQSYRHNSFRQREEAGSDTCRENYRAGLRSAEPIIGSLISMNLIVEVLFFHFFFVLCGSKF